MSICRRYSRLSSSLCIVYVELEYLNVRKELQFSGALEPPSVTQIIWLLAIRAILDARIGEEFVIFTKSAMLNNLHSIAQDSHYQHLDSHETEPALYISNYQGIERMSKQYRVDVQYPKTHLAYSRCIRTPQCNILPLRKEIQTHLGSTLLSRLMVSDLTPFIYSIQSLISTRCHWVLTYNLTWGMDLHCVYPLRITLEQFILLHSKLIFFLPESFESVAASTQSVICQTLNISV